MSNRTSTPKLSPTMATAMWAYHRASIEGKAFLFSREPVTNRTADALSRRGLVSWQGGRLTDAGWAWIAEQIADAWTVALWENLSREEATPVIVDTDCAYCGDPDGAKLATCADCLAAGCLPEIGQEIVIANTRVALTMTDGGFGHTLNTRRYRTAEGAMLDARYVLTGASRVTLTYCEHCKGYC